MTCIDFFQKVLMSDPQTGDLAGGAIAIHGDLAIVGAGLGDGATANQGAAYIFHKSDTVWLFEAKLTASDGAGADRFGGPTTLPAFGNAVNIFGNTAIVGATFHDSDATSNIGAAYIFTRSDDGTWTQTRELFASDPVAGAHFGRSVAINDQFAVIGNDDDDISPAVAHIFQKSDSIWSFTQQITPSDGVVNIGKWQIAIDNTTIIVGAADANSAYVFTYDGATWLEQAKLTPFDVGTSFGTSVDIACDYAVVGDQLGSAAYVFKRSDTTWTQQQKLMVTGGNATSVTIDGCFIAVGSQNSSSSQGQTLLYQRSDTTWTQIDAIIASDGLAGDNFGKAVALSYPYVIVGAPGDDSAGSNEGSAYFYHIACSNCCVKLSDLHAPAVCTDSFFDVFFDLQFDDAHVTLSLNGSDYVSDFTMGTDRSFHVQAPSISSDYVGTMYAVGSNRCCSDVKSLVVTVDTAVSGLAIAVNQSDTVCAGTEITLTASGAHHYLWFDGSSDNPHSFTPTQTSDYQVTGYSASNACSDSTFKTITVKTRPAITIAPTPSDTVCAGTEVTLTASGGQTYVWFDNSTSDSLTFTPTESSDYHVTGTSDGCSSDAFVHITVKTRPAITIAPSPSNTVCAGTPVTLTASGAQTYVWFDGSSDNPLIFTPTESSDYGVTGSSDLCSSDASVFITVKTRPVVAVSADSDTVCSGNAVTLTASGAQSYVWFDGSSDNPLTFTPTESSDYTVTGTSDGCSSDAFVHITVKMRPVVTIDASATVVCSDKSVTLTASGAETYVWFDNSTSDSLTFTPTESSDYRVVGTSDGCSSDAFVHITVKIPVSVDAGSDRMIPTGSSTIIGVGPALSDVQYTWSPSDGIGDVHAFPTAATPPSDITYTVVAQRTDVSDCATSDSVTIHVCELLLSNIQFVATSSQDFQVSGQQFADEPGTRFVSAQYLNAPIQIKSFDSDGPFLFAFNDTPISDGALVTIAAYRSDCTSDVQTISSNTQIKEAEASVIVVGSLIDFTLTLPPELGVQIPNNSSVQAVFSDMCAYADAIDCQRFLAGLVINDSSDVFCSDALILQNPEVVVVTCSDNVLNLDDLDQRFTFSITNFMSDSIFVQYSDTSCQITHTMNLSDGNFSFQNSDVNFRWVSPCLSDSLNVYTNIFSHPLLIIDAEGSIADVDLIDCVCPCHNPTSDLLYTATLRDTAIKFGEYLEAHYSDYPSLVSDQCHVLYQGPIIAGVVRLDFNTRTLLYHDLYIPLSDVNICQ